MNRGKTCADPESFFKGGPTLRMFFFSLFFNNWIQIPLKSGHHRPASQTSLNAVSLVCRWWPNMEYWLGSFVIFQGIRTSIAKKLYIFVIFQGGGDTLSPPLWIRTWKRVINCFFSMGHALYIYIYRSASVWNSEPTSIQLLEKST